jgi:4-amino-4-deoxy-L-arabinose transferase-like glycosyltransferase
MRVVFQLRLSFSRPLPPATPIHREQATFVSLRQFALLFAGCLLFHVAGTWTMPLVDRDEPRFAQASREMLERRDFVVPYFNGAYRFDKPPLTYWCQALSYAVFGENDFAARLPTVIASALVAVVLLAWGARMGAPQIGWWAAIIFTLCWQTFVHGKAAVADMWLVLFVTLAHWAAYELMGFGRERQSTGGVSVPPPRVWWWTFWVALAFAFLAKGPIGWTPLLAVAACRWVVPGVHLQRRFLFGTGAALMLGIVAVWGIPALIRTQGQFFDVGIGKHVVSRSLVAMEGHGATSLWTYLGTLPFYFVAIFVTFLPWSFFLPQLTKRLWRSRDAVDNYLIVGIAVVFVIFTFVKTKLPHYTLPAYPLLALLLAKSLARDTAAPRLIRRGAVIFGGIALAIAAASPLARRHLPALQLLEKAAPDLTPTMEWGASRFKEPSLVWYFRKHLRGHMTDLDRQNAEAFMAEAGPRLIVLPTETVGEKFPTVPADWKRYDVRGVNTARLRR